MNKKLAIVALTVLAGGAFWAFQAQKQPNPIAAKDQAVATGKPAISAPILKPGFQAQAVDQSWQAPTSTPAAPKAPEPFYGHTPETPRELLESSEQAQSNLAALRDPKQFPHRLTSMIQEKTAFDFNRWENDPAFRKAYLAESVPSRAMAGNPDPRTAPLQRISELAPILEQDSKVQLTVRTAGGAPVTFHSPALNRLESGLTTFTTVADSNGYATCIVTGVSGTIGNSFVTAASPYSASTVVFRLETTQSSSAIASKE
jgi:hypothetical protein